MRIFWFLCVALASLAMAQPRISSDANRTRVVFTLPDSASYTLSRSGQSLSVRFSGTPRRTGSQTLNTRHLVGYKVAPIANGSVYTLTFKSGVSYRSFGLGDPKRLVIDFSGGRVAGPSGSPARPVVVLDAGHGGLDPGATGYAREKDITLDVVLRTKRLLEAAGIQVVLTRASDRHLSPDKRTDLGLRAEMANSKRTLFVSVHANSASSAAQGIEVYYFGDTIDQTLLAKVILENGGGNTGRRLTSEARTAVRQLISDVIAQANLSFSRSLAHYTLSALVRQTGAVSRGTRTAPFYVIRNARIPAVLVEIGFVNHPVEGRNLADPSYRQRLAVGLSKGIINFVR